MIHIVRVVTGGGDDQHAALVRVRRGAADGDGLMDLAIGAPRDPTVGDYGGSVTVVFGTSL